MDARTSCAVSAALAADPYAPALVLVTHHVEEVPPGFTHGLLLRGGKVVAAGPVEEVLTDATLSEAFGLSLDRRAERRPLVARAPDGRPTAAELSVTRRA